MERVPPNPVHATTWGPGRAVPSLTPARAGLRTVLKASLQVGDEHERLRESLPSVTACVCVCVHVHTKAKTVGLSLRLGFDQVSQRIHHQVLYSLVRKTPGGKMRVCEFASGRAVRRNGETGRDPQPLEPPPRPHLPLKRQDAGRGGGVAAEDPRSRAGCELPAAAWWVGVRASGSSGESL